MFLVNYIVFKRMSILATLQYNVAC